MELVIGLGPAENIIQMTHINAILSQGVHLRGRKVYVASSYTILISGFDLLSEVRYEGSHVV